MKMDKVCKNCEFFEKEREEHSFGECLNPKIVYVELVDTKEKTDDMAIYSDYDHYEAYFSVGQNFGCIHWVEGIPNVINKVSIEEEKAVWVPFCEMKNLMRLLQAKQKKED
jgi:hypothetical protein